MKRTKQSIALLIMVALVSTTVYAYDLALVNSKDWRDVYSVAMYTNLKNEEADFLVDETQGQEKANLLASKYRSIWLVESVPSPFVFSYGSDLEVKGLKIEKKTQSTDALSLNRQLAQELSITKFILVNPTYGSDAIAICPYAIKTGAYVLFATPETVAPVSQLLRQKKAESIIAFGTLDQATLDGLRDIPLEIINENDRFANSIAIAEKFGPISQITLTDADFLERGLLKCADPIIYIGSGEPPRQVVDFIKEKNIHIANVVGNELFDSAQKLQTQIKATGKPFSIFMRFGQGTSVGGSVQSQQIRGLDILTLPKFPLDLTITSLAWNEPMKQLEVVYDNKGGLSWFKATIQIKNTQGETLFTIGDQEPFFIAPQKLQGRQYALDLSPYKNQELKAAIVVQYGETKGGLEKLITNEFKLEVTSAEDRSNLVVESLSYGDGVLKLIVQNKAGVLTYYDLTLNVANQELTEKGTIDKPTKIIVFPIELKDESTAHVQLRYGERQSFLLKEVNQDIPIRYPTQFPLEIAAIVLVAIIVIALLLLRRKKKQA